MRHFSFALMVSFLLALILSITPMPNAIRFFRPDYMVLAILWWIIMDERSLSLLWVWCLGLLQDLLFVSLLGEHALTLTFVAYLGLKFSRRLRFFSVWQQAMSVFLMVLTNQILIALIEGFSGHIGALSLLFYPAIISGLFWVVMHLLTHLVREKRLA